MQASAGESSVPRIDYDLLAREHRDDPYPLYAELRAAGPIHWSESLGGWGLTRHDGVRAALDRDDLSAARFSPYLEAARASETPDPVSVALYEALQSWFTFADPPGHTRLRALARVVIAPPMKAMAPTVDALVGELVERAAERGELDVIGELARPASVGTVVRLLGVPTADEPLFTDCSEALTDYIGGAVDVPDRRDRAWRALGELRAYLTELVRERTRTPGADLVSALIGARRDGDALSEQEVVATAAMMLFAGHGTSTNTVGNGLLALMRNPEQQRALADGSASPEQAVEEFLRYDSPVQITVRNAACDGALGCPEIRAGDRVFLFIGSANRDLAGVERADELDVRRAKSAHITFGYGIHFCIGAPLARIEVPIVFRQLLARFASIEPLVSELRWQPTVGFRGLRELRVGVRPR